MHLKALDWQISTSLCANGLVVWLWVYQKNVANSNPCSSIYNKSIYNKVL